jgi:hypothetical protein
MQRLLNHHAGDLAFPDCTAPWLATLAHYDVTVLQTKPVQLELLKPHFPKVVELKLAPSDIDVRKVGE